MHRLIVALLATVDAAIAVAVGIAVTLAPLTLLWVFGFGGGADWGVLWPSAVSVWQLGNLVPLTITLPPDYLAATGIDAGAASFVLSLAPLAFAAFTAIFAARSGARASHADAWLTGVVTSTVVFAGLTTCAALTGANTVAHAELWHAVVLPTLVFALPALVAAVVTEWSEAGSGAIAGLRDRIQAIPHGWGEVPALVARGSAVVVVGLIGVGAAVAAVALFARAGQIVALFQAGDVDALGATVLTIAQLAYVPTLAVWGMSFAAGPGFAVGEGTAVSPAGTQVGVVPGLPALGAVPDSTTSWLLLLALLPIAIGALAGWIARSRLLHVGDASRPPRTPTREDPIAARLVITAGIALVAGGAAALLCAVASGSLGPGRLAEFGPEPGPVALAVGLEVLLGAAILLLSPRSGRHHAPAVVVPDGSAAAPGAPGAPAAPADEAGGPDADETSTATRPAAAWLGRLPTADVPVSRPDAPRAAEPEALTEPIDLPGPAER